DRDLPDFAPPEAAPATRHKTLHRVPLKRTIEIDLTANEVVYNLVSDGGELGGASLARIEEINLDIGYTIDKRFSIAENDPLSARVEFRQQMMMRRDAWSVRLTSKTQLTATKDAFRFEGNVEAFEGDTPFASRVWSLSIPRRLV
ncbi:MAG TPA: hypothetical protein VF170_11560, partial [Planctomycetaceae bacterium]